MRWNNVDINLAPVQATAPRRVAACRCPRGSCTTSASRPARPPASPPAAAAATCARYSPGAQWRTTGSNSFAAVVAIYNQSRVTCHLSRDSRSFANHTITQRGRNVSATCQTSKNLIYYERIVLYLISRLKLFQFIFTSSRNLFTHRVTYLPPSCLESEIGRTFTI